ncbi:MAG: 4-alpha-glucanotransferase, partial [Polyangiales bacterium]
AVHLPDHYPQASVAFTGTHDSDTTLGWYRSLKDRWREGNGHAGEQLQRLHGWTGTEDEAQLVSECMRKLSMSSADTVVFPMQDVLNLDGTHRMNQPGTIRGNWTWRIKARVLDTTISGPLRTMAESSARVPAASTEAG